MKEKLKIYRVKALRDYSLNNSLINESWKQNNIYLVKEDKYIVSISNESGLSTQFDKTTWNTFKNNFAV